MKEILVINPRRKRKRRAAPAAPRKRRAAPAAPRKRRAAPAAPRKRKRRAKPREAAISAIKGAIEMPKRRRRRKTSLAKNPSTARRRGRAIARRAGGAFMGLNFREALKNLAMYQIGMMAAKWTAKRFGPSALQTDPSSWNYGSYLKGALGGVAAGMAMNMLKPGTGQRVMEGALNLMAFQLWQNELVQKNEWATGQFGQSENQVVYDDAGTPFLTTSAGEMLPLDERHREELPMSGLGDALEPVSHLGEALVRPGTLGQADPIEQYYAAYRQR